MLMGGVSVDYAFTQSLHANIGVDVMDFGFGQSPVSAIDGSYEPYSHTTEFTAKAGVGFAF